VTLVETVLSVLILGGAFVAALNTIGSARASQGVAAERRLAMVLAQDMMAEILAKPYKEEGGLLGLELGENTGNRLLFDDIDDYNGWSSTPPKLPDGTAISGAEDYTIKVTVSLTKLLTPSQASLVDEGMKLITVTVKRGSKTVAFLHAYRSDTWSATGEGQ